MENGTLYYGLDCLDVLESLEDNKFSLIYLDIPPIIGGASERVDYSKIEEDLVEARCRIKKGETENLSVDEIERINKTYEKELNDVYSEYLYKVIVNCYRVLKNDGIIMYREMSLSRYGDMKYVLDAMFSRFGTRALETALGFDYVHFYKKGEYVRFPWKKGMALELFNYEDTRGKYMLIPVEFERDKHGNIHYNGLYDPGKKRWIKERKILEHLYRKGDIILLKDKQGNLVPKLKYYRHEHQVKVSFAWNRKNVFGNSFDIFTVKGDEVLSIYENFQFASCAEKKGLIWSSVVSDAWCAKKHIDSIQKLKGKYTLVESICDHKERDYKLISSMDEFIKAKEKFFRDVIKECQLNEQPHLEAGNTTDEILNYFIEEYIKREKIKISQFAQGDESLRQAVYKVGYSATGKAKSRNRSRAFILRIAVRADMTIADIKRALELSGIAFDEKDNVADKTFTDWYLGGGRDINECDILIKENCKKANWTQKQIDDRLLQYKSERKTGKKQGISKEF